LVRPRCVIVRVDVWNNLCVMFCFESLLQKFLREILNLITFLPFSSTGSTSAAFIKWGQWASTRTDMFPDRLCYELEQLQSSAPKHPWSFSEQMMESSLGLPTNALWDVFDDFDREPLASGSIAQVYKAQLAGKPVAVKIRHPRVMQLIDMDFRIMTAFARICDYIPALSWLHIRESVEQFSHTMAAQAHLQVEGHHLEMLNHNFRKWPSVNFPHPIYASSAVIIETFEPGAITSDVIDSYEALAAKRSGNPNSKSVSVVEVEGYEDNPISRKGQKWSGSDLFPVETAKFIVTTGLSLYLKMVRIVLENSNEPSVLSEPCILTFIKISYNVHSYLSTI